MTAAPNPQPAPDPPPDPPSGSTANDAATAQLERLVWQELRECYDPEIPVNIVELGLVYAMRTEPLPEGGHRVEVLMTVTSTACGMSESCAARPTRAFASCPAWRRSRSPSPSTRPGPPSS